MFQFNVTPGAVPEDLLPVPKEAENSRESGVRKSRRTGRLLFHGGKEKPYSIAHLVESLKGEYVLADVWWQLRHGGQRPDEQYATVRFTLVHRSYYKTGDSSAFKPWRPKAQQVLSQYASEDWWRQVRVFDNPYYENGVEVSGDRCLVINCEVRQPLRSILKADCEVLVPEGIGLLCSA